MKEREALEKKPRFLTNVMEESVVLKRSKIIEQTKKQKTQAQLIFKILVHKVY